MNKKVFFPEHVVQFTSTRDVDFTFPLPSHILSLTQLVYLKSRLGLEHFPLLSLKQVHGADVFKAEDLIDQGVSLVEGDALICQQAGIPIMVRTADCQPVFIYDQGTDTIGIVHAGWKSTQLNILVKTLELMHAAYGTKLDQVTLVMGPSLRKCCYEVGPEFSEYFPLDVAVINNLRKFDITAANVRQAVNAGVHPERIFDSGECTGCQANKFFSYRREKAAAGRMISVIMKK
ncbi:MAG: peptidoglycan editing factor PgeF [Candidatus Omnitrophica bacterium]|nr:peptidoglycan editing factor PgeF [Candidatus Omnitrophota bacterium]